MINLEIYENSSEEEWRNVINGLEEKDVIKIGEQPGVYAGLERSYEGYEYDFFPVMIYEEKGEMKKRTIFNPRMYVDGTVFEGDLNFPKYQKLWKSAKNEN